MTTRQLVTSWYARWDEGDYKALPLSDDFQHTSPYGTIEGRKTYLDLVRANKDKFLGNEITILDELYESDRGCTRYSLVNPAFSMDVTEWFYIEDDRIRAILAYYNIEGEISESRKLQNPE